MTNLSVFQNFIHQSRYSRFIEEKGRRETWEETVQRYFDFFQLFLKENNGYNLPKELRTELQEAVLNMDVMPSMRCMMTAGTALQNSNLAAYNCSFVAVDNIKVFGEVMYTLMNGVGVGFSVESKFVNKLPEIPEEFHDTETTITIADSRLGWSKGYMELIGLLYSGNIPKWDLSKIRPAGSILKTFGGRASGPGPLHNLFQFTVKAFQQAKGRQLTTIEAHDIICMIGESVVAGGSRRSALISLSDLSDDRMRNAKTGQWWSTTPWRSLSNNSAVYNEKQPLVDIFMSEWKSLYDSKSGERGIFSRYAAKNVIEHSNNFRKEHFGELKAMRYRETDYGFGCNPCSEILLRSKQFCNLTEGVVRTTDKLDDLKNKVRIATILGTFQACVTNFKFLSKDWINNTEDERLLGVSLTGIMDNALMNGSLGLDKLKDTLIHLRETAIATNLEFSKKVGIPMATAITAVKPSGTVSQLVDSASGIHPRHSEYYIRTVRINQHDPIGRMFTDQGFYCEPDKMRPDKDNVFYFPIHSPKHSLYRNDLDAIKHLDLWKTYQLYWTEHKPSITVSVKEHEWLRVGAWVFDNFEWASGISFLPFSDSNYEQMPFIEVNQKDYDMWNAKTPKTVDWEKLKEYDRGEDNTTGSGELACAANMDAVTGIVTQEGCLL